MFAAVSLEEDTALSLSVRGRSAEAFAIVVEAICVVFVLAVAVYLSLLADSVTGGACSSVALRWILPLPLPLQLQLQLSRH